MPAGARGGQTPRSAGRVPVSPDASPLAASEGGGSVDEAAQTGPGATGWAPQSRALGIRRVGSGHPFRPEPNTALRGSEALESTTSDELL